MKHAKTLDPNRVGGGEKLSYFLANVGNIPLMTLTSSFLLIFYTNVVGLDPAAVATLFLISRILDGINDPVMGFLMDRMPRTKMGKFRPMLIIGTVICALNYVLLWFGPVWAPSGKLVIVYITYLLLGLTFDLMDISLNSLLPVMTADNKQRNKLSTVKGVGYIVGTILVSVLGPMILGDTSNLQGYYVLILGTVFFVVLFSIVGALGVKERVEPVTEKKYTIKEELQILMEKPVLITFLAILLYSIATTLVSSSNTYFFTYIIPNLEQLGTVSLLTSLGTIPGILLAGPIISKFGKKACHVFAILIPVPFMILRLFAIQNFSIILLASVISGISSGIAIPMRYGMQADNTDYIILKRHQQAEAAIASLSSFISKCAMGIGGAIPGYLLAWAGFQKDAAVQPDSVNTAIIACTIVIPAVLFIVAAVIFGVLYPLNQKKLAQQNEQLQQLRESGIKID